MQVRQTSTHTIFFREEEMQSSLRGRVVKSNTADAGLALQPGHPDLEKLADRTIERMIRTRGTMGKEQEPAKEAST